MGILGVWLILFQLTSIQQVKYQRFNEKICWNEEIELKWSDFQGKPDVSSVGKAGCAAELSANGFWDKGLPNFHVSNCFDKLTSWTTDTISSILLEHERLHFDIAEVHARRIRKSIDSLRHAEVREFDPYSEVIQSLLNRRNTIDSLYDKETAHGVYISEQKRWEKLICGELESLKKYSSN